MRSRWSTVLAAVCLTVMALGSGRAAHALSVTGHGATFSEGLGVNLSFTVSADNNRGGFVRVASGPDQLHFEVAKLFSFEQGSAGIVAFVTQSTHPLFPVGTTVVFSLVDRDATGDMFQSSAFGVPDLQPITRGNTGAIGSGRCG